MNLAKTLYLFCDESDRDGTYYSNFYGGVLVSEPDFELVTRRLEKVKLELNLNAEVKWSKVSDTYLEKYMAFVTAYFDEIRAGRLKVRLMFKQKAVRAIGLNHDQRRTEYFILYYQFIKHSFGISHLPKLPDGRSLRIFLDQLPDKNADSKQFKVYLADLQRQYGFKKSATTVSPVDINEVRSHDFAVLQGLDIVLGSVCFRLNDKHLYIEPGKKRRGKKTVAKEKLYKHILKEIRTVKPNFNIGCSTSQYDENYPDVRNYGAWSQPYSHWIFVPENRSIDESGFKGRKKN